VVPQVGI